MNYVYKVFNEAKDNFPSVQTYHLGQVDPMSFWQGSRCEFDILRNVRLYVRAPIKDYADSIGNPLSWLIWSDRLVEISEPLIHSHVQVFPAPLLNANTNEPIGGYSIINVLSILSCVNIAKSKTARDEQGNLMGFYDPYFESAMMPSDVDIFRVKEWIYSVYITDSLRSRWKNKNIRGLLLERFLLNI